MLSAGHDWGSRGIWLCSSMLRIRREEAGAGGCMLVCGGLLTHLTAGE